MRLILNIPVKESIAELKQLQKQHPNKYKILQMLLILRKQGNTSKKDLALLTGASDKSIQTWRTKYQKEGLTVLLKDTRGGNKIATITTIANEKLAKRLNNPKEGFRSFIEIQQWLQQEFNIEMEYHAVNKFVKRRYGASLKVSRKSPVLKSPTAEVVFKKPIRKV